MSPSRSERLGSYKIVAPVRAGGMGAVNRAARDLRYSIVEGIRY